jgi:hypothetical protein
LTLFGKVTIIKSLIVPHLTYLLSVLPNPGQNYLNRLHIETVLSLFFYNKTFLYLLIALWLFLEFLHIKEINKEKSDIYIKSELAPLGRSRMEIYTHNFSPGMKITVDKMKILGITIV